MSRKRLPMRWRIAYAMNRLPGQCWSDLVPWALGWRKGEQRLPWMPQTDTCRNDAARTGCCYCGKLQRTETTR